MWILQAVYLGDQSKYVYSVFFLFFFGGGGEGGGGVSQVFRMYEIKILTLGNMEQSNLPFDQQWRDS